MAKSLILQGSQYLQGAVTLYRGDQWTILAKISEVIGGVGTPVSLAAASGVTAFFPSVSGQGYNIAVPCTITDPTNGYISCVVPVSVTPTVALVPEQSSWYVQAMLVTGLQTITTPDQPLVINDPNFTS
jgi:hypothetical protein